MKKVAIMTWYQHKNYGTTLQAMALQKVIKNLGYDAVGINYISKGYDRETFVEKILSKRRIKEGIHNRINARKYGSIFDAKKDDRYNSFLEKNLTLNNLTQTSSQLYKLNESFDAFVCGSDQIWSPNEFNSKYYLDFVEDENKKIAYAPSFGVNKITDNCVKQSIGELVSQISHLSVREKQAADMIKEYFNRDAKVVIDPTLLLDSSEWMKYANRDLEIGADTLLCYFLGENEEVWKKVEKIAREKKLEIVVIPVFSKDYSREYRILEGVGPAEFISLFSKTSYVCTDSFHGTVFSILFKKEFYVFKRFKDSNPKSQNSRIVSLLSQLELEKHFEGVDYTWNSDEWEKAYKLLVGLRRESLSFLTEALQQATLNKENKIKQITNTCCGCGICTLVCVNQAIELEESRGFYRAKINSEKCINCGLCKKVCSFNGENGGVLKDAKLFECKSLNLDVLKKSTSGGISYEIMMDAINDDVPVYGCEYSVLQKKAVHTMSEKKEFENLKKYQGSKYLPSDFVTNLKSILEKGQGVIIGTPCQIAGVDNYLRYKKERNDYVLIDLICHGVPSYLLWEKYLDEKGFKDTLKEVKFRNPDAGWRNIEIFLSDGKKNVSIKEKKDLFYSYFDLQVCYMESCYECNYRESSKADLRLGDYWGKKYTKADLENGVSMVVAFTEVGEGILKKLQAKQKIFLKETRIMDYYTGQGPANPVIPVFYNEVLDALENESVNLKGIRDLYFKKKYYNKQLQFVAAWLKKR